MLSVNGHGEAILSPQRLAKTNIVPAFWSSRVGKRERRRKSGTPSSVTSSLLLHSHNGVSQVSFSEVAVYGLAGEGKEEGCPSRSAVSRIWGFDLIRPSHQHCTGPQQPLNVTPFTTHHIFSHWSKVFQNLDFNTSR